MHTLPLLGYQFQQLEPFIDEATMRIHYSKHHQAYLDNFNAAIKEYPDLQPLPAEQLLKDVAKLPPEIRQAVINHAGGYVNHSLFWQILRPVDHLTEAAQLQNEPGGELADAINHTWGFEQFKTSFTKAAMGQFGSGWAWLVLNQNDQLEVMTTANQDSPLSLGKAPLLNLDVWEHAYYLKYQNRRADYVANFWPIVNWPNVEKLYLQAKNS